MFRTFTPFCFAYASAGAIAFGSIELSMITVGFWSTNWCMMFAWSCGFRFPLTALNLKPSRRPASAAALCCASQYGLPAPCSSQTMLGFAVCEAPAAETATTAAIAARQNKPRRAHEPDLIASSM